MKKIYILIITLLSLQSFSQKDNSRYYNSWRLGLNGGAAWQTADMRSCWGAAGGFTLERGLGENATNFFSFAIRGRYLAANTYGMDYVRNYNFKDNDAYNGNYDLGLNYADTAKYKRGYVYDNYKMTLGEGSLELQLTFNRLRERTGVLLNLWGGVGVTSYRTKTDLLDGDGKLYDFSKVDSSGTTKAINTYNSLIDKKYESNAYGSKNGNLVTFSPSGGVGLGYQFTPGFSMLLEYKITLPQGTSADLLDGKYSNNSDAVGGNNDYYHYAGLNLLFTLRGKKKDRVVKDETVYTNTVVPTNSLVTTNTIIPTNSIVPTNTVTIEQKPIISYITPPVSGQISSTAAYKISAQILNVTNANQIQFKFNSVIKSNFTFNPQTHILEYNANLNLGANPIQIIATNTAGSDNESTTVIYEQTKPAGNPPGVTITNPSACPLNVQINQFNVVAYVSNIAAKNNISVKVNNITTNNFEFNPTTGQVNVPMNLVNGSNSILITVNNQFGTNSKSCVINYAAPQQTIPPPIITFINPAQSGQVSTISTYNVKAQILNIAGQNGASVYVNGMSVPFVYNSSTKQVSFTVNLLAGSNPITIHANNTAGDDTEATEVIYNQPVASGNPPQVNLVNPNTVSSTVMANPYNFKLSVLNVNSKNDINVVYNGVTISNFTYNTVSKQVEYSGNLISGINTLYVKGTNAFGSDSKTIYLTYTPPKKAATPPVVTITNPNLSPAIVASPNYTFKSTITNVPAASGLIVKLNGAIVTTYTYDGFNLTYPATLILGSNIFEVTGINADGTSTKNASVTYRQKQIAIPAPIVNLINPASEINATDNSVANFKLSVLNVVSKNDIEVLFNGVAQSAFTYNTTTKELDFSGNLVAGNNILNVKGTNVSGSDSKQISVVYTPHQELQTPPSVTFVNPANSLGNTANPLYVFKAIITNMPTTNGLVVKFNGNGITNYSYDGYNLEYSANLIQGNNSLVIAATNDDGSDSKTAIVNYRAKTAAVTPPIVTISQPVNNPTVHSDQYSFQFNATHVTQNQVEVYLNGNVVTVFNFTGSNGNFNSTLMVGVNTLMVKATNSSGTDTKTSMVTYEPVVETPVNNTPVRMTICHKTPGSNDPPKTISIATSQWPLHQSHGDTQGACPANTSTVVVTPTTSPTPTTTTTPADDKITICHIPPGNNQNPQTITISPNAWPAHQAHGDMMGACPVNKTSTNDIKVKPKMGNVVKPIENKTNQVVDTVKKVISEPINAPKRPR